MQQQILHENCKTIFSYVLFTGLLSLLCVLKSSGNSGYRLWLRYNKIGNAKLLSQYRSQVNGIVINDATATLQVAKKELLKGLRELLNTSISLQNSINKGSVVAGTFSSSSQIKFFFSSKEIEELGDEGFIIRTGLVNKNHVIFIAAKNDIGVLYGVFNFLRLIQTHQSLTRLTIIEYPKNPIAGAQSLG